MYLAVGKVKVAWGYRNSFHSFSHLKKLSSFKEKTQVGCMLDG